jgi:homoserine O-acetyltransferase
MTFLLASALLFANLGDLKLDNGDVLQDTKIGYRTYGSLNASKTNVLVIPTWFNGRTSDLESLIGPGNLFDDSKWYIITIDALSNGVSTSPANSASQKNKLFPKITIGDMVRSQHTLLTRELKINKAYAIAGISMGGMQVFEWMSAYPDYFEKAIPIVGTPKMSAKDIALWSRMLTKVPLLSKKKTEGEKQFANAFNFDPNMITKWIYPLNVLKQFDAVIAHDITRANGESLDFIARKIKSKTLVVVASKDEVVSPEPPVAFAKQFNAEVFTLEGSCGHNAFRCEKELLAPRVAAFLESRLPRP